MTQQAARARKQRAQQEAEEGQPSQLQSSMASSEPSPNPTVPSVKYKGVAYGVILHGEREEEAYDPFYLDDPELQSGKHRRVMSLSGLLESVIPFVRPQEV